MVVKLAKGKASWCHCPVNVQPLLCAIKKENVLKAAGNVLELKKGLQGARAGRTHTRRASSAAEDQGIGIGRLYRCTRGIGNSLIGLNVVTVINVLSSSRPTMSLSYVTHQPLVTYRERHPQQHEYAGLTTFRDPHALLTVRFTNI